MAGLQFAFGKDSQADDFKPHNYPREPVPCTETHDNNTTAGWRTGGSAGSTRTPEDAAGDRGRLDLASRAARLREMAQLYRRIPS